MMCPSSLARRLLLASTWLAIASAGGGEVLTDVPYDPRPDGSPSRTLDIHASVTADEGPLPVVVYVHGGGWTGGTKARVGRKPAWAADRRYLLVSVGYRLLPAGRHPAAAEDVAAAIAWLSEHAAEHGGDPEAIFLLGHSSGGHTVSLVATDPSFLAAHGLGLDSIRGVVALDTGAFDLEVLIGLLPPAARTRYFDVFGVDPGAWRRASPRHQLDAARRHPPFLLLVAGAGDSTHLFNTRFASALEAAGGEVGLEVFADETHGSINARLGAKDHRPTAAVDGFLDRVLGRRDGSPAAAPGADRPDSRSGEIVHDQPRQGSDADDQGVLVGEEVR